jgi:hypothetical protein
MIVKPVEPATIFQPPANPCADRGHEVVGTRCQNCGKEVPRGGWNSACEKDARVFMGGEK